jgi:antirestriction protein
MADSNFEGITNEYRNSQEYKSFMEFIKKDNENLPQYLCEMAIAYHKIDPMFYKQAIKDEQKKKKSKIEVVKEEEPLVDTDAVKIYDDINDLPPTIPMKVYTPDE